MADFETGSYDVAIIVSRIESALRHLPTTLLDLEEPMDVAWTASTTVFYGAESVVAEAVDQSFSAAKGYLYAAEAALQDARASLTAYLNSLRSAGGEGDMFGQVQPSAAAEQEPLSFTEQLRRQAHHIIAQEPFTPESRDAIHTAGIQLLIGMGLPRSLAETITVGFRVRNLAIAKRVREVRDGYTNPYQIVTDPWETALVRINEQVSALGIERFIRVCEVAGYACPDRYTTEQLLRMSRLIEGEALLPDEDITLVLTDAFGDYNNGAPEQIGEYENYKGTVYFAEIQSDRDLYRRPVMLARRFGLKPSTTVLIAHGGDGYFTIGGRKEGEDKQFGAMASDSSSRDIQEVNISGFVHRFMVPSRVTGERAIIISTCGANEVSESRYISVLEAIARQTEPDDKITVSGSGAFESSVLRLDLADPDDRVLVEEINKVHRMNLPDKGNVVLFWDVINDVPAIAHAYRMTRKGLAYEATPTITGVS